ncbi:MAG: T9SS type A sorting domain-containing protein [Bacteroidetes bacterium]|nr:T9SS type A sorting domain-containing protein [Bacteroidota bacterium]
MGQSAIAAGHESTLESAEEILRLGGNAFDAAISSLEHREVRIRAFPNPTDSKVMVESDQLGTEEIRLLDHIGRDLSGLVEVMRMSDTQVQLDMVRLPAGVYLLSVGTSSLRILR